jgi:hypothetical protein
MKAGTILGRVFGIDVVITANMLAEMVFAFKAVLTTIPATS